ncbi:MAG: DUF4214 domain-containing protein [Marivita sp.]|uniref:DUF4214 domain-containing protein n=1 Tax=Marivita sp. TaxID=2003365 RepID=UPI003EF9C10A
MAINPSLLTNQQLATAIYIAYYDRAADPVGSTFWEEAVANPNVSLENIATLFATQRETLAEYPFFLDPQPALANDFIVDLYLNLFNRTPDAAGLTFWSGVLQGSIAGENDISVGQIVIEILLGAQNVPGGTQDQTTIMNKIDVATAWTNAAEEAGLTGENDYMDSSALQASAKSILNQVTSDFSSVIAAQAATQNLFDAASGELAAATAAAAAISAAAAETAQQTAEILESSVINLASAQAYKAAADVAKAAADKAVVDAQAAATAANEFAAAAQSTDSVADGEEASAAVAAAALALEAMRAIQTEATANAATAAEAVIALTPATPVLPTVPTNESEAQILAENAGDKAAASLAEANGTQAAADTLELAVENLDTAVAYKTAANAAKSAADIALADAQAAASAAGVFAGFAAATPNPDDGDIAAGAAARAAELLAAAQAAVTKATAEVESANAAVAGESPAQQADALTTLADARSALEVALTAFNSAGTEASAQDLASAVAFRDAAAAAKSDADDALAAAVVAEEAAADFATAAAATASAADDVAADAAVNNANTAKIAATQHLALAEQKLTIATNLADLSQAAVDALNAAMEAVADANTAIAAAKIAVEAADDAEDVVSAADYADAAEAAQIAAQAAFDAATSAVADADAALAAAQAAPGSSDDGSANAALALASASLLGASAYAGLANGEVANATNAVAAAEAIADAQAALNDAATLLGVAGDEKTAADVLEAGLTPDINVDELDEAQAYLAQAIVAKDAAEAALDQAEAAFVAANEAAEASAASDGSNDNAAAQLLQDAAAQAVADAEEAVAIARAEVADAELAVFENSSNTYFLTTTEDIISGGPAADTFVAPFVAAEGTVFLGIYGERSIQTLGHPDVLDGGGGIDSLYADMRFDYDGQFGGEDEPEPTLTSIENIFLRSVQDTAALSLENAEGVEQVWSHRSTEDLRVGDVQNLVTFGMRDVKEGTTFNVEYDPTAHPEGDNFAQALVLDGVGDEFEDVDFVLTVRDSSAQVDELNITATGENYIDIDLNGNAGKLTDITITGDEGGILNITEIDGEDNGFSDVGDLETLDATAYTGDLSIDLEDASDSSDSLTSAKLGSGDDYLRVHASAINSLNSDLNPYPSQPFNGNLNNEPFTDNDVILDGGDGDDTLEAFIGVSYDFSLVPDGPGFDFTNVSNFETLVLDLDPSINSDALIINRSAEIIDLSDTDFTTLVMDFGIDMVNSNDLTIKGSADFAKFELNGTVVDSNNSEDGAIILEGFETVEIDINADFGGEDDVSPFNPAIDGINMVAEDLVTATITIDDGFTANVNSLEADKLETLTINLGEGSGFAGPIAGSANALTTVTITGDNASGATLFFGKEEESLETIDVSATDGSVIVGFEAPITQELTVKVGEGNLYYGFADTHTDADGGSAGPDGQLNLGTADLYVSGNLTDISSVDLGEDSLDEQDLITQMSDARETFQFLGDDIGTVWISDFDTNTGQYGDRLDFSAFEDLTADDLVIFYNDDLLGDDDTLAITTDDVGTFITSELFDGEILLLGVDATDVAHSFIFAA